MNNNKRKDKDKDRERIFTLNNKQLFTDFNTYLKSLQYQ